MRRIQGVAAAAIVLLTCPSFADPAGRDRTLLASIIRGARTDGERACKVLDAARELHDDPELQRWLLGEGYEYGLRATGERAGYRAAEEAMGLQAAGGGSGSDPSRRKLRRLYESRYRRGTAEGFDAAWKLTALDIEDAGAAARASRWAEALGHYRHAAMVIRTRRLGIDVEVAARILGIEHRLRVELKCRKLAAGLETSARGHAMRNELIRLHVAELDDPAGAAEWLSAECEEVPRTYVPLAAKAGEELAGPVRLELARWYSSLSAISWPVGRAACLLRAKAYYESFLGDHHKEDREGFEARKGLERVEQALRGAPPLELAAGWLLRGCDWASFRELARGLRVDGLGPPPLGPDAGSAVKRGTAFLLSLRRPDGSWPPRGQGPKDKQYPAGPTALAVCALLQGGLRASDPRMVEAMDWLAGQESRRTYTLALRCNVWMLAETQLPGRYRRNLLDDARRLIHSTRDGSYGYDCRGDGKGGGCNSNSQFGLWGVYCAARANVPVPSRYWPFVLRHWLTCQRSNGGWAYNQKDDVSATMTAAGLFGVSACLDRMSRRSKDPRAVTTAAAWLEKHFTGAVREGKYLGRGDVYYFLYAVARAQTVRGQARLGGIDWYEEGKEVLLKKQARDGSWDGKHGRLPATSFALLFLTHGRTTVRE